MRHPQRPEVDEMEELLLEIPDATQELPLLDEWDHWSFETKDDYYRPSGARGFGFLSRGESSRTASPVTEPEDYGTACAPCINGLSQPGSPREDIYEGGGGGEGGGGRWVLYDCLMSVNELLELSLSERKGAAMDPAPGFAYDGNVGQPFQPPRFMDPRYLAMIIAGGRMGVGMDTTGAPMLLPDQLDAKPMLYYPPAQDAYGYFSPAEGGDPLYAKPTLYYPPAHPMADGRPPAQKAYGYFSPTEEGAERGAKPEVYEDSYIVPEKCDLYSPRAHGGARPERPRFSHKTRKINSLEEIGGSIYEAAKDQTRSRQLQILLQERRPWDIDNVFAEVVLHTAELMMHCHGNYLIQMIFEVCTDRQRMLLVKVITVDPYELIKISLDPYGTRAMQTLIRTLKNPLQIAMVVARIQPGFLTLINNPNGSHVIQCCLENFRKADNKFIFDASVKHCMDVATHQNGCCVLQRCINRAAGTINQLNIAMKVAENALFLAQHKYGNYVVQYVLKLGMRELENVLLHQFRGNFIELSTNRCSSNVVETCLVEKPGWRSLIIMEFLSAPCLADLINHEFANYVIYTALETTVGHHIHQVLKKAILPLKQAIGSSLYCKKIYSRCFSRK